MGRKRPANAGGGAAKKAGGAPAPAPQPSSAVVPEIPLEGIPSQPAAGEFDTNATVLPSERHKAPEEKEPEPEKRISKRKQRKLKQLKEKREGQELRAETLKELKTTQLTTEQANLLRASHSVRFSKSEQLALAKQRLAMGVPLTKQMERLQKKPPKRKAATEEMAVPVDPRAAVALPVLAPVPQQAAAPAAAPPAAPAAAPAAAPPPAPAADATTEQVEEKAPPRPWPRLEKVRVERTEAIDEQRAKLPGIMVEQELVEMALENDVMLVCGDTGCGKSTQVPQFLLEAGLCDGGRYLIGVTQPRRVAAISVSQRVGQELNSPEMVGYQVRYDKSHCTKDMRIKFMTDGILLREVQSDFMCRKYSTIIIDEAHERGVNCDILIGLLSRAVQRRRKEFDEAVAKGLYVPGKGAPLDSPTKEVPPPLRLVIMSATLRLCDFTENRQLFPTPPPVLRIDARTFPVTAHFARYTDSDYIKAAHRSVLQIHKQLPPGTILVFVTGRHEVHRLCGLLRRSSAKDEAKKARNAEQQDEQEEREEEEEEEPPDANDFLNASDDEAGNFDDELDAQQTASSKGKRKKQAEEEQQAKEEKGTMEEPKEEQAKEQQAKEEQTKEEQAKEGSGSAAPATTSPAEEQPVGPKRKKKRREGPKGAGRAEDGAAEVEAQPAGSTEVTPPAGPAAEAEKEEFSVCYRIDKEEDVVVLDPEANMEAENKQDAEAKNQKRVSMSRLDRSRTANGAFTGAGFAEGPLNVLPLYAQLPARAQLLPFAPCPEGKRNVVVATNVAETSVTLPNVRFVVDTGREKRRTYRASSGVSAFEVGTISKASADQRAGRAGRLGPGHAYRLYSAAVFENYFTPFAPIAMLNTPMDPVLLLLAFLGVPRLDVFPWPTPPSAEAVAAAARRLRALGAITNESTSSVRCTRLGFRLAALPIAPRYAKILLAAVAASQQQPIVGHACALVAALSVGNLTCWESAGDEDPTAVQNELLRAQLERQRRLREAQDREAPLWSRLRDDMDGLLWLMGGYSWALSEGEQSAERFCNENRVNARQISEAHSLMQQLAELLRNRLSLQAAGIELETPLQLKPPSPAQVQRLRECIVDGLVDRVAVERSDLGRGAYACGDLGQDKPVFVHNSSNVFRNRPRPTVLVFNEVISTASARPCMRDCVGVDSVLLARRAATGDSPLLKLGEFLAVPAPRYLRERDEVLAFASPRYAPLDYVLPTVEVAVPADSAFRYKIFAKALLEGGVLTGFPRHPEQLLSQPSLVLHAPTNQRVSGLVGPLWQHKVGSCAELLRRWGHDGRFLLDGYLKWLPASLHADVSIGWPPVPRATS